jgi:hypothetical protein
MTTQEIRKQISIFVPLSDWKALRAEAARRRTPMTELCRQWLRPHFDSLEIEPPKDADG